VYESLLDMLRCPYCGTRLELANNDAVVRIGDELDSGVLGCQCCAFPIVAGIPVLVTNAATGAAIRALEARRHDEALTGLLGLDTPRASRMQALLADKATTFQEAIEVLSPDPEGTYFVYRFSDPTFRVAEALVMAADEATGQTSKPRLDLCGGSGHLTRVLSERPRHSDSPQPDTIVADLHFWKLWLATRFTAPGCAAVCCDAEAPLPFHPDLFSLVVLADAFPYIWNKRLCADEMLRVADPNGVVLMPHLHSALGENMSAGDTLTPSAYRDLFATWQPRLFSDTALLDELLDHHHVDLTTPRSPASLDGEPSLALLATRGDTIRGVHTIPTPLTVTGQLKVNPLYRATSRPGGARLTLQFPSQEYEQEFGTCRRYLPETVDIPTHVLKTMTPDTLGDRYAELRRRRVILDLPLRYCP